MTNINYVKSIVGGITALDQETRISVLHNLMMEMEDKNDITRWAFWDRFSVKEHAEEISEKTLSEPEVDAIMEHLHDDWNNLSFSVRDTNAFTEAVSNALNIGS
jgi:hypothetical protein